jgi:NAD(P)-dependent dehydrogenase (short-subunit alcohol dehydrogenase family)
MNVKQLFDLTGNIILVSGGAGNYGKCIAEGLAEAGATVIIASRNLEKLEEVAANFRTQGLDVYALQVDQGDHQSVLELSKTIIAQFGKLDGFVNNSVARTMKSFDAPIEDFAASMEVNATGMMDILRELGALIAKKKMVAL